MKYQKWNQKDRDPAAEHALTQAGIPPLTAAVLAARGIAAPEEAARFLAPEAIALHDPFLLRDMDRAVARIRDAVRAGEHIAVYGDYDVDGITSTCLLTDALRAMGAHVTSYVPDRLSEGYSLNPAAVQALHGQGVTLIVTVDCGITNDQEVAFARSLGLDVVVTDHHECKETLPDAVAVVNPHRPDCPYPFKELAGVGVALHLALALAAPEDREDIFARYCDLTAIGTVADVMLLTGVNRTIVSRGLRALEHTRRPGLRALLFECGLEGKALSSTSVSFSMAPRINAAGRMGQPALAVELLLTKDPLRAQTLARALCDLNQTRQAVEQDILAQCLARLQAQPALAKDAIVLADHSWHQGVVGIVASRLSEQFSVPVFMICLDGEMGKGSCRSWGDLNLFRALESAQDLLEGYGGHDMAAGFTIREENVPAFRARMQAIAADWAAHHPPESTLSVDLALDHAGALTMESVSQLQALEPFGPGNPQPVLLLEHVCVVSVTATGKGRHSRLKVRRDGQMFDAILFSYAPEDLPVAPGGYADLAFYPQVNEFRSMRSVQLLVTDLRAAPSRAQQERSLYRRWTEGQPLSPADAAALTPQRQEFVAVWRYLTAHAAGDRVDETPARLSRNIAKLLGRKDAFAHTMICLRVLDERGLIQLGGSANFLQIRILPARQKVDLESSHILRRLRGLNES